ncbi:ABC transporter ATP-binding protein [bacterium]|nr:MAG: ABC transporter ATP-binding protein [bacterium]
MRKSELTSPTLLGYIWANRRHFRIGMSFALARIISVAAFPIIFKLILDRYMPQKNLTGILYLSALMIALLGIHQYLIVQGATRLGKAITTLILKLRAQIFTKTQYLSFGYLDQQKTGQLLSKYAFDTQKVEGVMMPVLNSFIPDAFYCVITIAILVVMNWQLSMVVLLILPFIGFMRVRYFGELRRKHEANRRAQEKMTGSAAELFGALRLVRSYGEENQAKLQLRGMGREVARARVDLIETSSGFGAMSFGATKFLTLVVVAGGGALSVMGQVTVGTVIAFVAGLPSLVQPIQLFTQLSDQYFLGQEAYNSIKELLDEDDTEPWKGTATIPHLQGRIEFDHVSFRYAGAEKDALHDFSLTIEPGEKVALVGSSGAGKSTLTSLLLGLYTPTSGEIRIDGVPQSQLDMRWLRQQTALVMQESVLLSGTLEDNIRFARVDATDEQVLEATHLAHAREFIEKMPDGLESIVGERGVMLSGGQRQRISIARALLRDPAILILDEPTSALDYESERLIQDALDTLANGRTVLTIAHRLSTIRGADRVVVLSHGRITEQGNFAKLWQSRGFFHKMLLAQGMEIGDSPKPRI